MSHVTAIVLVRDGAERLPGTLQALGTQDRVPDALVVVDLASRDSSARLAADFSPARVIIERRDATLADALAAVRAGGPPAGQEEMYWILSQDHQPDSGALAALLAELERSASVAIVGPKLIRADRDGVIFELGETMTRSGESYPVVSAELDQGQHDVMSDVLGVSAAGMLIRARVYQDVGGFNPAVGASDAGLELCLRARMAGYRVVVAPLARIIAWPSELIGPAWPSGYQARLVARRRERRALLFRRLSYAPALWLPALWLGLVPLALARTLWLVVAKAAGQVPGEWWATFTVALNPKAIAAGRRRVRQSGRLGRAHGVGRRAFAGLLLNRRQAFRARRDAPGVRQAGPARPDIAFFASGGGWLVLALAAVSIGLSWRYLTAAGLAGGALGPLGPDLWGLWKSTLGWQTPSGLVPADPFSAVLASLGTATWWSPSYALVLLWLLALPGAGLVGFWCAARFTPRTSLRVVAGILWALSPSLHAALVDGRPGGVITHLLLPLTVAALWSARQSAASSARAALLIMVVAAATPSLLPSLLAAWLIVLAGSGRRFFANLGIIAPTITLFAPLVIAQLQAGRPWAILTDPGPVVSAPPVGIRDLLAFSPSSGLSGGLSGVAPDAWAGWIGPGAVGVLLVIGLVGSLVPGKPANWAVAGLGLAAISLAEARWVSQIGFSASGDRQAQLWLGGLMSLAWLGLGIAVLVGIRYAGRLGSAVAVVVTLTGVVVALPFGYLQASGSSAVVAAPDRAVPALVAAQAQREGAIATLLIEPQRTGGVRVTRLIGSLVINAQRTALLTRTQPSPQEVTLATLAASLTSLSTAPVADALASQNIRFVLLSPAAPDAPAAVETAARAKAALATHSELTSVGSSAFGSLWRVNLPLTGQTDTDPTPWALAIAALQAMIIAVTFLLALPISKGAGAKALPEPFNPLNAGKTSSARRSQTRRDES